MDSQQASVQNTQQTTQQDTLQSDVQTSSSQITTPQNSRTQIPPMQANMLWPNIYGNNNMTSQSSSGTVNTSNSQPSRTVHPVQQNSNVQPVQPNTIVLNSQSNIDNVPGLQELLLEAQEKDISYTDIYDLVFEIAKSRTHMPAFATPDYDKFHGYLTNMTPLPTSSYFPSQAVVNELRSETLKNSYLSFLTLGKVFESSTTLEQLLQAKHFLLGSALLKKSVYENSVHNNCVGDIAGIEEAVCGTNANPFASSVQKVVKKKQQEKKDVKLVQGGANNKRGGFFKGDNPNNKRGRGGYNNRRGRGGYGGFYGGDNNGSSSNNKEQPHTNTTNK